MNVKPSGNSSVGGQRYVVSRLRRRAVRIARQMLVPFFHAVSLSGARGAEFAASLTVRLPRTLWATAPQVRVRRLGLWFELDLRDNVQRTLYFTGWYERRYLTLLIRNLRPHDVYIDVGAHIGIHAQVIARHLLPLGGRVIAFEPAPDTAATLVRMVEVNGLTNVDVVPVALGETRGQTELRSSPARWDERDAAVRSFYGPGRAACTVDVLPFDEWTRGRNLPAMSIVKIDVEGAECAVLSGMKDSILRLRPRVLGVEIRDDLLRQAGRTEQELLSLLGSLGYKRTSAPNLEGNSVFSFGETPLPEQRNS